MQFNEKKIRIIKSTNRKFHLIKVMLQDAFKEGETGIIKIDNIDPDVVKVNIIS